MSVMSELSIDIQEMLEEGYRPVTIASILNVPVTWVYSVAETQDLVDMDEEYNPHNTINS